MISKYIYTAMLMAASAASSVEAASLRSLKGSFCNSSCVIANIPAYGTRSGSNAPPCWFDEGSHYSCYDYNSAGNCNIWPGALQNVHDCKHKPTKKPTNKPTKAPTASPTAKPTPPSPSPPSPSPSNVVHLSFHDQNIVDNAVWKLPDYWIDGKEHASVSNSVLTVKYPKGSYSNPDKAGISFSASPLGTSTEMTVEYQLYVPDGFNFVKGGKLPGLYAGVIGDSKCSGGQYDGVGNTCATMRLMWRAKGVMEAYVYLPKTSQQKANLCKSSYSFCDDSYGWSLMRGETASLQTGQWNDLSISVKMNTPGQYDGSISLSVNGKSQTVNNVLIRNSGSLELSGIDFESFFGGGESDWATPTDQNLQFRNFKLSSN